MQPEKKIKAGAVIATIWNNKGKNGDYVSVKLSRTYMDKENQWKESNSFRETDLPKAGLVLEKAYEYIQFRDQRKSAD